MKTKNYYLKRIVGIYCFTHIESGRQYVGQSIDCADRFKSHTTPRKGAAGIKGAIMKYGVEAFKWQILEECKREELNEREIYWIAQLGTLSPDGYNLTSGGGQGTSVSDETKAKVSAAGKGRTFSEESKAKMSAAQKGRTVGPMSEESKAKISAAQKGRVSHRKGKTLPEETKEKMSAAHKGRTHSEETKEKMSESKMGIVPWNKGKTSSDKTKAKQSEALKEYFRKRKESAEACKESDSDVYLNSDGAVVPN